MTGDAAAGGDARLAGADDFILKPFAVKELVTRAVALTRRVTGSVTEPPPSARVKAARAETRASGPAARLRTRRPVEDWDAIRALLDEHRADVEAELRRSPLRMLRLLRRSGGGPLRPAGLADALGCSRASVSRAAAEIRRRISAVGLDLPCERSGYTLVLRRSTEELPAARDPR